MTSNNSSFKLLESLALVDGSFGRYRSHINRIKNSAKYFHFKINIRAIEQELACLKETHSVGLFKVRLTVTKNGMIETFIEEIENIKESLEVCLAKYSVDSSNPFLLFKTTNRNVYNEHRINKSTFDTLLWNEKQELTEFTIGNLVLSRAGMLYTPSRTAGLLPGTFRAELLEKGIIQEKILTINDLNNYDDLYLVNSVRGWIKVDLSKSN